MIFCICKLLILYQFFNILGIDGGSTQCEDDKQWSLRKDQSVLDPYVATLTEAGFTGNQNDKFKEYDGDNETAIEYLAFLNKTNFVSDDYRKMFAVQKVDFPKLDWTKSTPEE
ncbi:uncharacterized protein LOC113550971 [Rhopalosiphum maidis]|uniref:uncharacterized protein LOC113550970 n=1 Tax=Rhopalosiphum maidis TaxID=43146 RepID=UPI000EFED0B4|nr:uncharacterized protein LOC113550970 [Rhopalosiphum maidis]XP_026808750.1 uncharacterized protein LOC113550971 [Rhopalosiphum maidis]